MSQQAAAAYDARLAKIQVMLAAMTKDAAALRAHPPEGPLWPIVGDLGYIEDGLSELSQHLAALNRDQKQR